MNPAQKGVNTLNASAASSGSGKGSASPKGGGTAALVGCSHTTAPSRPLHSPEAPRHLARAARPQSTMDQHKEKEEEDKFQESSVQPRKEAAEEVDNADQESAGQQPEACKEGNNSVEKEEEQTVQLKTVEAGAEEEASSSAFGIFAYPCSLLRCLLRFCAGCWGLHGAFGDGPKPQAAAVVTAPEDGAPANSSEQGDGGEKANYFYMEGEVVTRVWAVRRRPPGAPGHPREGSGGNGGHHN